MPYKLKNPCRHKFKPAKYRTTNWKSYNQALKNRGDITIWFNDKAIKHWYAKNKGKPGGQKLYSNLAIETAGIIRLVFHLALRQTQGFMMSIVKLMNINLPIPDYTTISRRARKLHCSLSPHQIHKEGTYIIIDGSGLSVYGADEFYRIKKKKMRVKGYRKLHIAINEHHQIVACELTTLHKNEQPQVPKLLKNIHDHCEYVIADKNYDFRSVYQAIKKYRPTRFIRAVDHDTYNIIIPPRNGAAIRYEEDGYPPSRNDHIRMIADKGLMNWQRKLGYGKRSLVEVAFSRYKRIFGKRMKAINFMHQKAEASLACKALNIMSSLGMPITVRI